MVLVVAASGLLPDTVTVLGTAVALAVLTLSFARDIRWQYRHR
jgi:hypothetical protein